MPFVLGNSVVTSWYLSSQATDYSNAVAIRPCAMACRWQHKTNNSSWPQLQQLLLLVWMCFNPRHRIYPSLNASAS